MAGKKPSHKGDGVKAVAEMMNFMDAETRKRLLSNVAGRDPKIAAKIESQMFLFEDLVRLSSRSLQILLHEVAQPTLILALRKAPDAVKDFIFENLSERSRLVLKEEVENQGQKRLSEVQAAQLKILQIAKRLAEEGKISLDSKSEVT